MVHFYYGQYLYIKNDSRNLFRKCYVIHVLSYFCIISSSFFLTDTCTFYTFNQRVFFLWSSQNRNKKEKAEFFLCYSNSFLMKWLIYLTRKENFFLLQRNCLNGLNKYHINGLFISFVFMFIYISFLLLKRYSGFVLSFFIWPNQNRQNTTQKPLSFFMQRFHTYHVYHNILVQKC